MCYKWAHCRHPGPLGVRRLTQPTEDGPRRKQTIMHFVRKPRVNILKGRVEVPEAAAGTPRAAMNNSRGRDQLQDILDIAAGIYHFPAECSPLTKTPENQRWCVRTGQRVTAP